MDEELLIVVEILSLRLVEVLAFIESKILVLIEVDTLKLVEICSLILIDSDGLSGFGFTGDSLSEVEPLFETETESLMLNEVD